VPADIALRGAWTTDFRIGRAAGRQPSRFAVLGSPIFGLEGIRKSAVVNMDVYNAKTAIGRDGGFLRLRRGSVFLGAKGNPDGFPSAQPFRGLSEQQRRTWRQ
jgi:hypothetical protein